jgi:hypothetical protein
MIALHCAIIFFGTHYKSTDWVESGIALPAFFDSEAVSVTRLEFIS